MSWLGGYKPSTSKPPEVDPRQAKRDKLQAERLARAEQREKLKKQVKAAQEAKEAADLAASELLALDPDILTGEDTVVSESEIEQLLADVGESILDEDEPQIAAMVDFEEENGNDSATAMDNLRSVQCPFNKGDIEFWFSQFED